MMKRRFHFNGRRNGVPEMTTATTASSDPNEEEVEWEMRPGGMLVQKRSGNSQVIAPPNLRVRVVYGAARYQISANSQSTFGELKKLLAAETGLEPGEQRLIFRGKERENGEYLDTCGVKDRAKVVLIEDPESKERRLIEMRRNAKIQAIHRLIDDVSTEVDRLAEQVCIIEKSIGNGNKVAEVQITTLMEMLMRQAVKLDSIPAEEGDACVAKKDSEGKRVQKCVETLDVLKESNGRKERAEEAVVVTAKWETFDQSSSAVLTQWELFD